MSLYRWKPPACSSLELFGTAQATLAAEGNACRVDIATVDGANWHARITKLFDDPQAGATYTLRFRAKADAPRRIWLGGFIDEPDWHSIGLGQDVPLTEAWQDYRYEFQAKDLAAENLIIFNVGDQTGTVWIADFTLTKGGEIRPVRCSGDSRRSSPPCPEDSTMPDQTSESSANYILLTRLADEFAARYRAGERPPLQEYIDRYPELADDIRELFPAMVEIEQVKDDHQQAAEPAAAPPAPALRQLGDFRIIREVGKGGMGIVYEAEQVSLGRHVALKVLPRSMLLDAKAKRRFEREAKAAAKLHHTNIVPVFGVGEQDGMPYYVMQFIQGLGLDEVLEELKNLKSGGARAGSTLARGQPHRLGTEISAAQVARSLLTGEFRGTE